MKYLIRLILLVWCFKNIQAAEVYNIREILLYANLAVALDLVGGLVICWKICSIQDLAGFHFLVPK